ncbi:hypothetical protein C1H46_028620 [Malus baccata]|uniref:Protein ARV n=1 Tax=Malus baccata TaxID=106549 RepID=A0A540LH99_MALBA|nr:hypothetical protein C1H46_028620 [Malus baccata]
MEYRCVECGGRMTTLFVQYSPGNIRLMKCGNCKAVADEYIECEPITKAYTHLLYNVIDPQAPSFQEPLPGKKQGRMGLVHELRFVTLQISKDADGYCLGNIMFLSTFLLAMRILFSTFPRPLRASAGNIDFKLLQMFLIAMMVWEYPSVILIIDIFVSSSNTVALKVITRSPMSRCIAACFSAHVVKVLVTQRCWSWEL